MKKIIYSMLPICLLLVQASAQSISQSVIAVAGGYEKTPAGMTVSWTVGEPIVDPLRAGDAILTQGFQQPDLQVTTGFIDQTFAYELKTFPNPTSHELVLETDYEKPLQYQLVDLTGKVLRQGILNRREVLQVTPLPSGVYAMNFTADDRLVKSDLIQKH